MTPARLFLNGRELTRIAPGVYVDVDGGMHLVVAELLVANGYVDTPENRETVVAATRKIARDFYRSTSVQVIE